MIDDATIKRVAQSFVADGCIKQCKQWGMGYEKDENGEYIKPVVPALIYEFARAIEQLARQEQREADARLCEVGVSMECGKSLGKIFTYPRVAEAIRASGKENSNE